MQIIISSKDLPAYHQVILRSSYPSLSYRKETDQGLLQIY